MKTLCGRTSRPHRRRWRSRVGEIYELLHPETKAGTAGANARWNDASDNLSFASATSEATGKDKRTVERAAARGEALGDDLKAVEGTSLDKGVELDALAKKARPTVG
ncbi:hypothetical protein [Rhodoblastus acidophilus]|uniref:hypothetical protein n=1 Tax=Rhodoblastus acidophilus TaxID=1074 RepID=UPI00113265B4|nr:hypothetical protein [Rhodoblastus acidophilus]